MLQLMRTMMHTLNNRRLHIQTILSSLTIVSMRSLVHILSHQRAIHSSRTHTPLRRVLRTNLRHLLNTHISITHHLIRSRSAQINRRRTHRNSRLTLTNQRNQSTLLRRHIMPIKRFRSRLIHIRNLHHHLSFLINNIRLTMTSILTRITKRSRNILRRRTRLPTRQYRHRITRIITISHRQTLKRIMRTQRRISSHHLTNTHQTSRHSHTPQFSIRIRRIRSITTILLMTRRRIIRISTPTSLQRIHHIKLITSLQHSIRHLRSTLRMHQTNSRLIMRITSISRQVPRIIHMTSRHSRRTNNRIRTPRTRRTGRMSRQSNRRKSNLRTQPRRRLSIRNIRPHKARLTLLLLRNPRLNLLLHRNLHNLRTNSQLISMNIRITLLIKRLLRNTPLRSLRRTRPSSRRQRRSRTPRNRLPISRRRRSRHSRRNRRIKSRISRAKTRHIQGHIRVISRTSRSLTIQTQVRMTRKRHLSVHRSVTTRILRRRLTSTHSHRHTMTRPRLMRRSRHNRSRDRSTRLTRILIQSHLISRSLNRMQRNSSSTTRQSSSSRGTHRLYRVQFRVFTSTDSIIRISKLLRLLVLTRYVTLYRGSSSGAPIRHQAKIQTTYNEYPDDNHIQPQIQHKYHIQQCIHTQTPRSNQGP